MVYLKIQPYMRRTLATRMNEKLFPLLFWLYKVIQRIGPVAYKLELSATTCIHTVFHVSQLKKALGAGLSFQPLPAELDSEF